MCVKEYEGWNMKRKKSQKNIVLKLFLKIKPVQFIYYNFLLGRGGGGWEGGVTIINT